MTRFRRSLSAVLLVAALLTIAVTSTSGAVVISPPDQQPAEKVDPRGTNPDSPNPLVGLDFFVDKRWHPSWRAYRKAKRRGHRRSAKLLLKIAEQPQFRWFGDWEHRIGYTTRIYFRKIRQLQPGSVPMISIFRHPHPRSQSPNQFGRRPDARRRWHQPRGATKRALRWVRSFKRAVGRHRVVIAFEPDSLGSMYLLSARSRRARYSYMRQAIKILSGLPRATIYLEGGASDWRHAKETAGQLKRIGIHRVRGFMLNVTHFDTTARSMAHGMKISRRLGGKPFVISTHANGNGALHYRKRIGGRNRRVNVWCNPRNSALGERPTTDTGNPKVDAFLWIGRAGYSAGRCGGGPRAGFFWTKRALMLARRADW